ncbi:MAG: Uma2 family endonuclease [Clostridiales bacterium]|nr:Uma2 family endonuclease [Clostridiales bacterium]
MAIPNYNLKYTYEDYIKWDDDNKYEIIDGTPYLLASPSLEHQRISIRLSGELYNYFKNKKCEVITAPFDVVLFKEGEEPFKSKNIVQPDISIICDENKLNERGCFGSPNLIIEILSPSTTSIDYVKKLNLYQEYKVKEYWIVNPKSKTVQIFKLVEDRYDITEIYLYNDIIKVDMFEGLEIKLEDIFKG